MKQTVESSSKYQGFTNIQTWCAMAAINNTRTTQDRFLFLVAAENPNYITYDLQKLALTRFKDEIFNMAPWAFNDKIKNLENNCIDWQEIASELRLKIEDDALSNKSLKSIHIDVQSWRDKVYGNTYSSYYILVNSERIFEGLCELNTQDNALYYARERLCKAFKIKADCAFEFREYCEANNIKLSDRCRAVLKRELIK